MSIKLKITDRTVGLLINAPNLFERADFMAWLNDLERRTATWHRKGDEADEYSDLFVLVDSHYEGDSSDMPEDIWTAICNAVYAQYNGGNPALPASMTSAVVVRLTNLDE